MKKLIYILLTAIALSFGCSEPSKEPVKIETRVKAQDCPQPEPAPPKGKVGFYDCVDGKWVFVEDIGRSGRKQDTLILDTIKK